MSNPTQRHRILVVEDDDNERQGLERLLVAEGYQVQAVESADKALGYLEESIAFVLTDHIMGDVSGMDLLKYWKAKQPETMFLMITGHATVNSAVEAIRAGAYHYMVKPIDPQALLIMLRNMARQREESRKVQDLQERLDEKFGISSIIGRSAPMQRVFDLIKRSAQAFSTVLILGESGTGKELVAQAIHQNSPRRAGPFVAVNCAAMPASLVESELFGHEKGAFTGAVDRRMGRFESASGGTLFIDEIGEFEVSLQVKLLRVLESRVISPVGSNKEVKVDTRVVVATSRNIREMMARAAFREDLFYRLNVISIELPPLRQRLDDIPLLVKNFMDRVNVQNHTRVTSATPSFIEALQAYHWPGNVRELLNVVEGAMVLSDKSQLDAQDLPALEQVAAGTHGAPAVGAAGHASAPASSIGLAMPLPMDPRRGHAPVGDALAGMTLEELEQRAIDAALQRCNSNRTRAARALGISVRTLQRKLLQRGASEEIVKAGIGPGVDLEGPDVLAERGSPQEPAA